MSPTSLPLQLEQIAAASLLMERLDELRRSDRALYALGGCFPGFDGESMLLKVVALHALDASPAFAIPRLVTHFQAVLSEHDPAACGPELVDRLAEVPGVEDPKLRRRLLGYASRFAHVFLDLDRFPVFDAWAERTLALVAIEPAPIRPNDSRYVRFSREFLRVAESLSLRRERDLGPYLWLAGQYRAWLKNARTPIHRLARGLFESQARELVLLLPRAPVQQPEPPPALPAPRAPAAAPSLSMLHVPPRAP